MSVYKAAWQRSKREEWRARGICATCGIRKAPRGAACNACRDRALVRYWKRATLRGQESGR